MPNNGETLTGKQRRMIAALLTAPTIGAACEAVNVSRTTLARWLKMPLFLTELRQAESEMVSAAARGLLADLLKNHETLRELRDNIFGPDSIRLRAAVELDAAVLRWRNAGDFENRLTELEKVVNDGNNR